MEWLDIVWSLVLLNLANADQISSVLNPDFVKVVVGKQCVFFKQFLP